MDTSPCLYHRYVILASRMGSVEGGAGGSTIPVMSVTLPASSLIRVLAAEPALTVDSAAPLVEALNRLLVQFVREGRCAQALATAEEAGRFIIIAWDGPPLSGCSHDKLNQVVAVHEVRAGVRMLDAPPLAIGAPGAVRLTDRAGLRVELQAGRSSATTPVWDLRAATLADWQRGPQPLAVSPFARLLSSAQPVAS